MPNPNDGMSFWEEDSSPEVIASDISISTDDKKREADAPALVEEEKKPESLKADDKADEPTKETETPSESKKEEAEDKAEAAEEASEDLDLSDLFADLEDASNATEESKKILDDVAASGTITPDQAKELQTQNTVLQEINAKNSALIKKMMNDSVDMSYRNAELEAFGWVSTDPNVLILSKNIEKARSGDDKSKSKIITILKNLYEDFTGEDLEKTKVSNQVDLLSAAEKYNSHSNPNIKSKSESTIEWLSM